MSKTGKGWKRKEAIIKMDSEDVLRRSGHEVVVRAEERADSCGDEGSFREEVATKVAVATKKERTTIEADTKASSSSQKEQDDQLESARAEMGEVREENQRLKINLDRIMKNYRTLQMQFYDIIQQEETKNSTDAIDDHQGIEEHELVSLSLGRNSSEPKRDGKNKNSSQGKNHYEQVKEGFSLGLDCTFEASKFDGNETVPNPSPMNSFDEPKEEAGETWPPSKILKTMQGRDEVLRQNPAKKARVSVRARCDTPTMNDGCQWRKYGQKIAKGNPCPRAYYRCTVAPTCPVRKQVQRCVEDMSILITTYEGTHNHPLPISATTMASTTSAAASILLSGSLSSSRPAVPSLSSKYSSTIAADLHGLNYYLSDNSKSKQFYLHNSSLSSSSPYTTITLDLTSNPSSSSSHFNSFTTSSYRPTVQNFASTSLNFGSSESSNAMPWGNGFLGTYGSASSRSYNRNQLGTLNIGRPAMESSIYDQSSYLQMINNPAAANSQQPLPADTIAAATKAITADPSFQSALAAALTSIIGTGTGGANLGVGNNSVPKSKSEPVANSFSSSPPNGNPCATSYLNKTTSSTNSKPAASWMTIFGPTSLPFSTPTNASASPVENKDHAN